MPRLLTKSWLDSFLEYTDNTEIPLDWLTWAGISALSTSIKRNCWVNYRRIPFYPNQYVVLVGPPGIGKGEAIYMATSITNEAGTVNYLTDWNTPQEMIDELANGFSQIKLNIGQVTSTGTVGVDRSACILGKELAVVLQSYDNLHSMLCEWWDQNEFQYKTKNKGKYKITDMCISMLAACTPSFIHDLSRDRMAPITGGFTARCIFVYATDKRKIIDDSFGKPTVLLQDLKDKLTNDLKHINSISGEITLDQEAEKLWSSTYREHNKLGSFGVDAAANFKARISSHIIKTAIAISLADSDNKLITRDHLTRAIGLVENVRDSVDTIFRSVGRSPIVYEQSIVLDYLAAHGMATTGGILHDNFKDFSDETLGKCINVLLQAGKLAIDVNATGASYVRDIDYDPITNTWRNKKTKHQIQLHAPIITPPKAQGAGVP